ncbi:AI-2E family transporter [Enterococcus timonensis]|uniref:AI-2E family transporter n=1 Tax=Enterococcus timonensis TaxID=1852364 RepID=UPI0008DAD38D|nr:AI-2E family transporter [Enterococcus timonensis]
MEKKKRPSWFWKWFLNNQVVAGLLIVLLVLLILLAFTKVAYLFEPIMQFFTIVGLPILVSVVLYYFFVPVVDFLEKKKVPRVIGIILLFLVIIGLLIWGGAVAVPKIREQTLSFADNSPYYVDTISAQAEKLFATEWMKQLQPQIESMIDQAMDSLSNILQNLSKTTFQSIGNIVGAVANTVLVIITTPFILFYLLKDGKKMPAYLVQFLPNRWRKTTMQVLHEMNDKVSKYIRGQLVVAVTVAIMFIIGFSIIGLDYAVTFGVLAGFLNLIPYLGSFLAMIPAVFLALVAGPFMVLKVAIVFVIEQTLEGRFVSPLVLGSQLNIHPVTIIFVLLTSGKIFGLAGVVLGIPAYAALKVLVTYIFEWYKKVSKLYNDQPLLLVESVEKEDQEETPNKKEEEN